MTEPKRPKGYCKDCFAEAVSGMWVLAEETTGIVITAPKPRPAPHPGPRCFTHHHAERKRRKAKAQEAHRAATYGLEPGQYAEMYDSQGGVCAICLRAKGTTRALSVDHDHKTGEVRGLLCRPCNDMLGHARDDPNFFGRAMNYLVIPPARAVLGKGDGDGRGDDSAGSIGNP